jgi:signal peptidase
MFVVKRVFGVMASAILLLLVGFAVWLIAFSSYKLYVVHTGSMEPTDPVGSLEIVHVGHYRVGQVVSFRFHGETIGHRLLSINQDGTITTKGDANRSADPGHPPKSSVIGEVVTDIPGLGYLLFYVQRPLGIASIILVLLIALLLWDELSAPPPAPAEVSS